MALGDLPLFQPSDWIAALGSFGIDDPGGLFSFGCNGMSFDPSGNSGNGSLWMAGPVQTPITVGEISIPALSGQATILSAPAAVPNRGVLDRVGGTLVHGGRLIIAGFLFYDAGGEATVSHWRSADKTVAGAGTPVTVGTLDPGFYGGYMGVLPAAVHADLGGPCFTGQNSLSIIGRTSWGPALFAFDPDDIGSQSPVPVVPLLYYTEANPIQDINTSPTTLWNGASVCGGAFIPAGYRSACFLMRNGTGVQCYGTGQATDPEQVCEEIEPGVHSTYDPFVEDQGHHAWPYQFRLLCYDLLDLKAVHDATLQPWEPQPYANIEVTGIATPGSAGVPFGGLAYDPATRRVFVMRGNQYLDAGSTPTVFTFQHAAAEDPPAPDGNGGPIVPRVIAFL